MNQKTDSTSTSNEKEDTEEKNKKDIEKRNEIEKSKSAFVDIPSDMFVCHVCSKNMWDSLVSAPVSYRSCFKDVFIFIT